MRWRTVFVIAFDIVFRCKPLARQIAASARLYYSQSRGLFKPRF